VLFLWRFDHGDVTTHFNQFLLFSFSFDAENLGMADPVGSL
jgi:hypothetical protein